MSKQLVLATGNAGKLKEMRAMLAPLGYTVRSQAEFAVEQPPETGSTFIENALIKARAAAQATGFRASSLIICDLCSTCGAPLSARTVLNLVRVPATSTAILY